MKFDPFPTVEVPFDKDARITPLGAIDGNGAAAALASMVAGIDDLIVIAHGWNNDIDEARTLYAGFFSSVATVWAAAGLTPAATARTGVLALYWPSKKFDEAQLIPGGAAAIGDPLAGDDRGALSAQLANLTDTFGGFGAAQRALLDDALAHVPLLDTAAGQNGYVAALAGLFPPTTGETDPGLDRGTGILAKASGVDILQNLQASSVVKAAEQFLNLTTYYVMKERAGTVGANGAAPLIAMLLGGKPGLRVHLVGHSFGGRLVTSLANALPDGVQIATMSLLQAAYSHYGLAPAPAAGDRPTGAFRDVVAKKKVRDVIQITHSCHDWAVGAAYPIAAAIARDAASALPAIDVPSTAGSAWGGMGGSGAQQTQEAYDDTLLAAGAAYAPLPAGRSIRNLTGDAFISSHGDVAGAQVAWAFVHAFAEAGRA